MGLPKKNKNLETLLKKISDRSAVIGVVGLGYVGLPLILRFAEVGFRTIGFDVDSEKIEKINSGQSYFRHFPSQRVAAAVEKGLEASGDFSRASEADALIICVPTPLNRHRDPDLSFVIDTTETLLPYLHPGQVVSLESTTYPGTTEEVLFPRIESTGLTVGEDIFLVYSPEREDPSNPDFSTQTIPKVCAGVTPGCQESGKALYGAVVDRVVPMSSPRAAEMTKLLENIHRAVNVGLVNEMKILADKMGIDIHEVIRAAATKPFGFTPFYPGPGLGGHCIPIDPFYLTWKAREFGMHTHFIELAGEINGAMPEWVVKKIQDALNHRRKSLMGSKILVLGLAYKKNIDDVRESPAVAILELLRDGGALADYSDPHVPRFPPMRHHEFDLVSVPLSPENLAGYDCVVLVTNHDDFDYELIREHASLIVDTRDVYSHPDSKIVKA